MPPFLSANEQPAILALADGTVFKGISIGAAGYTSGEVVFNTAMTGYQEILTDPSYSRQIVTLTYPHIGNTGVNPEDVESSRVHAAGLIIRDLPLQASNFRSTQSLSDYLKAENIVAIAGIDTRKLTRILREKVRKVDRLSLVLMPSKRLRWGMRRPLLVWPAWIWQKWCQPKLRMNGPRLSGYLVRVTANSVPPNFMWLRLITA